VPSNISLTVIKTLAIYCDENMTEKQKTPRLNEARGFAIKPNYQNRDSGYFSLCWMLVMRWPV
jgi:hypothetical protein